MGLFRRSNPLEHGDPNQHQTGNETRLRSSDDWSGLLRESHHHPVLIFKHSTSCGISSEALNDFRRFTRHHPSTRVGVVHVIEDRSLSNAIAEHTGVGHETPQVIAIENERAIWHGSHWSIDLDELTRCLSTRN